MISDNRTCDLAIVAPSVETKLVWKGLLKDRLRVVAPTDLSLSDQVSYKGDPRRESLTRQCVS